jgi:Ca2+-binding RTX toxin-like protein
MATLTVGQGQQFATIGAAIGASRDGDVVQVQAGTYTNDFATINTKITLQGVGGMVHMVATGDIPNDKGILITNTDVAIDRFEFSGAQGGSGNAAGIRYQGGNLTVTNSYFHDNQNGLLGNPVVNGTITIRASEFGHNGAGDGYTHNLYVTGIAKLTVADSYFHDAVVGHQIKSRAAETEVINNRIFDNDGTSSYSIDLPNGGRAVLTGNTIQQGRNGENPNIVAFGEEGDLHANSALTMSGNTVLNDMGRGTFVWNASGSLATIADTKVFGLASGQLVGGGGAAASTTYLASEPALDKSSPFAAGGPTGPAPGVPGPATPGDDVLTASAASREIHAGAGNDTVDGGGSSGPTYLRGDEGNDVIRGGLAFDDINGNMGDDTATGGAGADWVVGGKDNDSLSGDAGDDIVYGNLGNDTCQGGDGADIVRGGQGDDVVVGGIGDDYLSGDRGNDTVTGGAGADRFHTFGDAGVDRVMDFHASEGDRVMLDPGDQYSAAQIGADTVITLTGGAQMMLVNVQLAGVSSGWIYTG